MEIEFAKAEFDRFAQATYDALVSDIKANDTASLTLLCRLDISAMFNESSEMLEYFVNEVERGCLVCLFGNVGDGLYSPHRIGDELREHILDALDQWYNV
jgi:hypothetical protein